MARLLVYALFCSILYSSLSVEKNTNLLQSIIKTLNETVILNSVNGNDNITINKITFEIPGNKSFHCNVNATLLNKTTLFAFTVQLDPCVPSLTFNISNQVKIVTRNFTNIFKDDSTSVESKFNYTKSNFLSIDVNTKLVLEKTKVFMFPVSAINISLDECSKPISKPTAQTTPKAPTTSAKTTVKPTTSNITGNTVTTKATTTVVKTTTSKPTVKKTTSTPVTTKSTESVTTSKTKPSTTAKPTTRPVTSSTVKPTTKKPTVKTTEKTTVKTSVTTKSTIKTTIKAKSTLETSKPTEKSTSRPETSISTSSNPVTKKSSSSKITLLILALFIICGAIIIVCYYKFKRKLSNRPAYYNDIALNDPLSREIQFDSIEYNENNDDSMNDDDDQPLLI